MNDLLLHPQTRAALEAFQQAPSHALILSGPAGSGKLSTAVGLSEHLLDVQPGRLTTYAYAKLISPLEGKSIGIEAVRELEHFLSLKVPSTQAVNRIVIVVDGHLLTTEAQNALLKTVEEPPAGTVLLLTTASEQALLPTIRSRTQQIAIQRPGAGDLAAYFVEQGFEAAAVQRAVAMSGGLPGLAQALLNDADHPLAVAARKARELLGLPVFERLTQTDELAQNRALCLDTLFILQQMAAISLPSASGPAARRWQAILEAVYKTRAALAGGAQPKLALTNFLLNI